MLPLITEGSPHISLSFTAVTWNQHLSAWPRATAGAGSHNQSGWRAAPASRASARWFHSFLPRRGDGSARDEVRPPVQLGPFMCQSEETMNRVWALRLIRLLFLYCSLCRGERGSESLSAHHHKRCWRSLSDPLSSWKGWILEYHLIHCELWPAQSFFTNNTY